MYSGKDEAPDAIIRVGDKVKIKNLAWHDQYKNRFNEVETLDGVTFVQGMRQHCGCWGKVARVWKGHRLHPHFSIDIAYGWTFTPSMIEEVIHCNEV